MRGISNYGFWNFRCKYFGLEALWFWGFGFKIFVYIFFVFEHLILGSLVFVVLILNLELEFIGFRFLIFLVYSLYVPDWSLASWSWFAYGNWSLIHQCYEFWCYILILKILRPVTMSQLRWRCQTSVGNI